MQLLRGHERIFQMPIVAALLLLVCPLMSASAFSSYLPTSIKKSSYNSASSISSSCRAVVRVYQDEGDRETEAIDNLSFEEEFDINDSSSALPEDCTDAVFYNSDFENDDDDDDDASCIPPGRIPAKTVFAISDSTGATVKSSIQKCLVQFGSSCDCERYKSSSTTEDDCNVQIRTFTFIRGEEILARLVKAADSKNALVVFTIADPILRAQTLRMCELSPNIPGAIDLLGPSIDLLSTFLNKDPIGRALSPSNQQAQRRSVELSDSYYKRIDAVEFTLKADDGKAPWLLKEADVIIVGVSRTGKTPLSVVLSQSMGLKVANIPLVLEVPAPKELFNENTIDPGRIFCLTIAPSELKRIRTTRLERQQNNMLVPSSSSSSSTNEYSRNNSIQQESASSASKYNDRAYVMNDLRNARELSTEYGWTQIDVTGRAVEETASFVSELLNERYGGDISSIL